VQALLEAHFAHDMGFTPELARQHAPALSDALAAAIDAYFAQERPADEVPPINGDPFTDSQEYPAWFAVQAHRSQDGTARVPVHLPDGRERRELVYVLRRHAGQWKIDDIIYDRGGALRAELAESTGEQ
jgi:hypothetical protein